MPTTLDVASDRMSGALPRGIRLLECLVGHRTGLALADIVEGTGISKPAAHRALADLMALGYVSQDASSGRYSLSLKLFSVAFQHVNSIDVVAVARPVIERLASATGELVRLSLVDGDRLVCVTKAQGSTRGLRYDDDLGAEANLFSTATGSAWLASLPDSEARALVQDQGTINGTYGPGAPRDLTAYLARLEAVRRNGFAWVRDSNEIGVGGIAAPIRVNGQPVGVLTIVGPSLRLTEAEMLRHSSALLEACRELGSLNVAAYPGTFADLRQSRQREARVSSL